MGAIICDDTGPPTKRYGNVMHWAMFQHGMAWCRMTRGPPHGAL